MWSLLSTITGIKPEHLWKSQNASVAQKMSWAAKRETTRTEDIAYSLLGLFNVNMPLLYGEGEKAFKRLQYEILQSTDDESIFAWTDDQVWTSGLLAESPANFAKSGGFVPENQFYRSPYTMTNQGLQIKLLNSNSRIARKESFETPLRCTKESTWSHDLISIYITYYADENGALRAFRTGPFHVGVMKNKVLRGKAKFYSFHIDDFRRPRLPPHWARSWNPSISLGFSGSLDAADICIFKNTDKTTEKGFSIVDRSERFFKGRSYQIFPMISVYWSHDGKYLTFGFPLDNHAGLNADEELFSGEKQILSDFKLQAGNSLVAWLSEIQILFIALSSLQSSGQARIDIQLDIVNHATEDLHQLRKADVLRADRVTLSSKLQAYADKSWLPVDVGSGQEIYGQEIPGIDPEKSLDSFISLREKYKKVT